MARLSKSHHFKIFEDTGIPTPPHDENDPFDDDNDSRVKRTSTVSSTPGTPSRLTRHSNVQHPPSDADDDEEEDVLPRDSLASVSSFPESTAQQNDTLYNLPPASPQKFFTPQIIRPSFRRPESVRRMQMSSPRQSLLSHRRSSRCGTPRSDKGRGSPRRGGRITEELTTEDEEDVEEEKQHFPLVLLHVTLLPIELPWSMESMQEVLPENVLGNLLLLRSKVSDMVAQRGVLIPHPREEYEMLEERLLEALDLKPERLTKCGHFQGRTSNSSAGSHARRDNDSGLGSGSEDGDICLTCKHHVCCAAGKKQKWSMKVFAANGMMRAAAWAAAWEGMESVDVEILPWIDEADRRRLDQKREEEERRRYLDEQEERPIGGRKLLLQDEREGVVDNDVLLGDRFDVNDDPVTADVTVDQLEPQQTTGLKEQSNDDLPPIYRAKQVPMSVLLRNYIYLLAQDPRNVAILVVGILAIYFAGQSFVSGSTSSSMVPQSHMPLDAPTVATRDDMARPLIQQKDDVLGGTLDIARETTGVDDLGLRTEATERDQHPGTFIPEPVESSSDAANDELLGDQSMPIEYEVQQQRA